MQRRIYARRGVYVAIRARDPQRESTIVSIRRRIKSTKTARSTDTERNSFRVYMRAINSGAVWRKGRGYTEGRNLRFQRSLESSDSQRSTVILERAVCNVRTVR